MTDAATQTEIETGTEDDRTLVIRRHFAAPREAVFRAWTEPETLRQWWGPEGCKGNLAELDVRPGGIWRTSMIMSDGDEHFVGGVYQEVTAPERLVFTWAWENVGEPGQETLITIELHDREGTTEMVFTQRLFQSTEQRRMHNQGWSSSLNRLAALLVGD